MQPTVYGSNHIAIQVTDAEAAAAFYQEVFGLERLREGEGNAFLRLGRTSSWRSSRSGSRTGIAAGTLGSLCATTTRSRK